MDRKNIIWLIAGGLVALFGAWYLFGDIGGWLKDRWKDVKKGTGTVMRETGKFIRGSGEIVGKGVTGGTEFLGEKIHKGGELVEDLGK